MYKYSLGEVYTALASVQGHLVPIAFCCVGSCMVWSLEISPGLAAEMHRELEAIRRPSLVGLGRRQHTSHRRLCMTLQRLVQVQFQRPPKF